MTDTCVCDAFCYEEEGPCFVPGHDSTAPYRAMTFAEVVDDYVLVRGDLSEDYAREQLVDEHERRIKAVRVDLSKALGLSKGTADNALRALSEVHAELFQTKEGLSRLRSQLASLANAWRNSAGSDQDAESRTLRSVVAILDALLDDSEEVDNG